MSHDDHSMHGMTTNGHMDHAGHMNHAGHGDGGGHGDMGHGHDMMMMVVCAYSNT